MRSCYRTMDLRLTREGGRFFIVEFRVIACEGP